MDPVNGNGVAQWPWMFLLFRVSERARVLLGGHRRLLRVEPGLLHHGLVVEEPQGVHIQRDGVTHVVVDAGIPGHPGEVSLAEAEGRGHVVERLDHPAGRVGRHRVDVHDGDLRALAGRHRTGQLGVVVRPLLGVHGDLDVGVLGVELVDELLHDRPVTAGEAVPELQRHVRTVVALSPAAAGDGLLLAGNLPGPLSARGQAQAQAGSSGQAQEASAGEGALLQVKSGRRHGKTCLRWLDRGSY